MTVRDNFSLTGLTSKMLFSHSAHSLYAGENRTKINYL